MASFFEPTPGNRYPVRFSFANENPPICCPVFQPQLFSPPPPSPPPPSPPPPPPPACRITIAFNIAQNAASGSYVPPLVTNPQATCNQLATYMTAQPTDSYTYSCCGASATTVSVCADSGLDTNSACTYYGLNPTVSCRRQGCNTTRASSKSVGVR